MSISQRDHLRLWSVILTGEEHPQASPLIQPWSGYAKPKPFCTFVGSRSMLQHTWDRADQLSHPNCKVTVVEKPHLHETCTQLGGRAPGMIITEPRHCGMVASLFLSLTYLQVKDPHSLVVAYPSGHFVYPEDVFLKTIQRTIWSTERFPDHIFMLGAHESGHQSAGGYITRDDQIGWIYGTPVYGVRDLTRDIALGREKPFVSTEAECLSNTCVLVGKTEVFWELGWQCLPDMMTLFDELQDAIGTSYERAALEEIFHNPKLWDTSLLALLQLTPSLAVVELEHVLWSDWGEPRQMLESLGEIGKEPAFPIEYARG